MCYSAQVWVDYKKYVRVWGADIGIKEFYRLYWLRSESSKAKIPESMDAAFAHPQSDDERAIKALVDAFDAQEALRLEQEVFKQRNSPKMPKRAGTRHEQYGPEGYGCSRHDEQESEHAYDAGHREFSGHEDGHRRRHRGRHVAKSALSATVGR